MGGVPADGAGSVGAVDAVFPPRAVDAEEARAKARSPIRVLPVDAEHTERRGRCGFPHGARPGANHALSLISFQLNLSKGKTGAFIISSVQVGNKPGGTTLVSEGTLDITTGDIIGSTARSTSASTVLSLTNPVTLINEKYCDPMRLMVIPPSGTIGTGDVETLFTINGETYKFDIPANTQWEKGKKYLYKLSFNGRSLQLRDVSITDWLPGNDEGLIGNIM